MFHCLIPDSRRSCGCQKPSICSGSKEYCALNKCVENSPCYCMIGDAETKNITIHKGKSYSNLPLITYQVCQYNYLNYKNCKAVGYYPWIK